MNVSLQNIDKVSAQLTVKLEKADYQEKVCLLYTSFCTDRCGCTALCD